jgi:DNA topoisomerase I
MTYLLIVESPYKCKKIEEYLGEEYKCISSKGHIREIKKGLKSIKKDSIDFEYIKEKEGHIEKMKQTIKQFTKDKIIIGTDNDREGEGIAWHICETFGLNINETKRIIFREVTKTALEEAIQKMTTIDMNIVNAQLCRQVLDMLVGFTISPVLWKHIYRSQDNSLSAGRCQTPALRLVYENDIEFQKKIVTKTFKITGDFYSKHIIFDLSRDFEEESKVVEFLQISKTFQHRIEMRESRECIKEPPKPLNTSSLLQKASQSLSIVPKETMSICQKLYQKGHITYMRTDSQKYSETFLQSAESYIIKEYGKSEYIGELKNIKNDNKNPHEAIRVTNINIEKIEVDNSKEKRLYEYIWRNTIESCMSQARYRCSPIEISAPMDLHYKYVVEVPIFLGFKKVSEKLLSVQETGGALLLYIQSCPKVVNYNVLCADVAIHGKHSHYSEASLIKKLEDYGIGRPSTFATIVDTIIERKYVSKKDLEGTKIRVKEWRLEHNSEIEVYEKEKTYGNEKGKLEIQPIGKVVTEFLYDNFASLFSYDYTKKMENMLDEMTLGNGKTWYENYKGCESEIRELISPIEDFGKQTYSIKGSEYKMVFEKYGPVLRIENGEKKYEYKKMKYIELDFAKLKRGEYHIDELIEEDVERKIGEIDGKGVYRKSGPYGDYIEYNNIRESVESLNVESGDEIIEKVKNKVKNEKIIRPLGENMSIRNGKYGAYIYYKTIKMKKPRFLNLSKFPESYRFCEVERIKDWIKNEYKIFEI